jgi:hypothetical protein
MKTFLAACLVACALAPIAQAQTATLSPQQLDQLVGPIALYPDPLLTDVLAAATYPAEVVEAERWVTGNAGVQGAALAQQAASQDWDPSVQALVAFPQVLAMMDSKLDWTEHLGRAFMAQQADVMNAVQRLRHAAQMAGALQNGPHDDVVNDGDDISINPPSPQEMYLPTYTDCAYGPYAGCDAADNAVAWDTGFGLPFGYWQWGVVDWGRRSIRMDHRGGGHFPGDGDGWHHGGPLAFDHSRPIAGYHNAPHFNYAPPATHAFGNGFIARPAFMAAVHSEGGLRAAPRAAMPHIAVASHGGGRR